MGNSRAKGCRGELELSKKLMEVFPQWKARRSQQFSGDAGDSDVTIENLPQMFAEVKRVQRLCVPTAMAKAKEQAACAGKLPVVFHRRDREEWLVTCRLEDWQRISEMVETSKSMREAGREG